MFHSINRHTVVPLKWIHPHQNSLLKNSSCLELPSRMTENSFKSPQIFCSVPHSTISRAGVKLLIGKLLPEKSKCLPELKNLDILNDSQTTPLQGSSLASTLQHTL